MSETFKVGAQPNQGSTRRLEEVLNQAQRFQQEHPSPPSEEGPEEPQEGADSPEGDAPDTSYPEQGEGDSEADYDPESPEEYEPLVVRVNGRLLQVHEPTWDGLISLAKPIQRLFDAAKRAVGSDADIRDALSLALKSWEQPALFAEAARSAADCADILLEKPAGWTARNAKASEMSMILVACLKAIPFDDLTQIAALAGEVK